MTTIETTVSTSLIVQLLELAVPRLAKMMGAEPQIGETRTVEGVTPHPDDPVLTVASSAGAIVMQVSVAAPEGGSPDAVDGVATVIAEEWSEKGETIGAPAEITPEGASKLADTSTALATDFLVAERHVGTVTVWLADSAEGGVEESTGTEASVADQSTTTGDPHTDGPLDGLDAGSEPLVTGEAQTSVGPTVLDPEVGRALGNLSQVELSVTVELGSTELTIKELMELTPGSVVRVGTQIGEPFSILVNGRVAARGDLVVVNGRLGVRIREIIAG